jgi:hypothetical protein
MFESNYVTHFVLHIRYEGKGNTVCSNRSYEGEGNALFCGIQVKKGKQDILFRTEVTKEIATFFFV